MDIGKLPIKNITPVLNKKEDYIIWKRKMPAYLEDDDAELISLEPEPDKDAEIHGE